jgi:hypothetical protein
MVDKHRQAVQMRRKVPSTIARSDDKAVRTYKKTLESAEGSYGPGQRAHRAAFASLKHTHEKVGDHWEPKGRRGPSDPQAAQGTPSSLRRPRPTAQGVDANANKAHLVEVAERVGVQRPQRMRKADLVDAIRKANNRATARARQQNRNRGKR